MGIPPRAAPPSRGLGRRGRREPSLPETDGERGSRAMRRRERERRRARRTRVTASDDGAPGLLVIESSTDRAPACIS